MTISTLKVFPIYIDLYIWVNSNGTFHVINPSHLFIDLIKENKENKVYHYVAKLGYNDFELVD